MSAFPTRCLGLAVPLFLVAAPLAAQPGLARYIRYSHQGKTAFGMLEGEMVRELSGSLFESPRPTGRTLRVADVRLLAPCEPSKVIAVGLNYKSHLNGRPVADYPGLFAKLPTSIVGPGDEILMPPDATELHYEGEMVIVIGRMARNVPADRALDYVFGVTAGNDVSERAWQRNDLQWFRAKGSDTFGPIGPAIARGINYDNLLVQTRVNGDVRQSERTSDLIFSVPAIVSYVSRYVTLLPGDLIFTGTPGETRAMQPGDVVEVEVEGAGVLRNTVARRP